MIQNTSVTGNLGDKFRCPFVHVHPPLGSKGRLPVDHVRSLDSLPLGERRPHGCERRGTIEPKFERERPLV